MYICMHILWFFVCAYVPSILEKFAMVIFGNNFVQNRVRNPSMAGGYPQQGYQARPPTGWGTPGAPPVQQTGYGYVQPGAYPTPSPQYNMSQPPYSGYPPQPASGGYASNWDQSAVPPSQQTSQGGGNDYYSQQPPSQQQQTPGGPAAPADNSGYYYGQQQPSSYNQQGQGYTQDGYGGYQAQPQSGYGQPPSYDQQQGYASAPTYGSVTNTTLYTLTICIIVESPIRWIKRMGDNISNTWISRSVKKIPISMIPLFKTNFEIRICVVLCLRESEVCVASPCLECICNRVHGFN